MGGFPTAVFCIEGDVGATAHSAQAWTDFGEQAAAAATDIATLDSSLFVGPEAEQYRDGLSGSLVPHLEVTADAHALVGQALTAFNRTRSELQDQMGPLAGRAPGLWDQRCAAQSRLTAARDAGGLQNVLTEPSLAASTTNVSEATSAVANAQQAWEECLSAAQQVQGELRSAVDTCCQQIARAAALRFQHNPHGWSALTSAVSGFVKDHAAGLARLSGVLKNVSMVCGVLAFVPIVGEIAAPLALVTGAAALGIDTALKLGTGQGSWTALGIDAALIAAPAALKATKILAPTARAAATSVRTVTANASRYLGSIRGDLAEVRITSAITPDGSALMIRNGKSVSQIHTDARAETRPSAAAARLPDEYGHEDLTRVREHLARLDHAPHNDVMVQRIHNAISDGRELTEAQRNFTRHELREAELMGQGTPYLEAHEAALLTHPPGRNYDRDVIDEFPAFGPWWRRMNGLEPR